LENKIAILKDNKWFIHPVFVESGYIAHLAASNPIEGINMVRVNF